MSATITSNAGGIKRSGITVENEPIIKSDGAGEVMQWQPSDGEADGIFIKEVAAGDKLRLGVGVELSPWAGGTAIQLGAAGHVVSADPYLYVGSNYYFKSGDGTGWKYTTDDAATRYAHGAGTHTFSVSNNTPAVNGAITWTDALTISSAANVGIGGSPTDALLDVIGADPRIRLTGAGSGGRDYYLREQDGDFKIVDVTGAAVRLTIDSAGAVSIPGAVTIGSLDIGHGLGGDTSNVAVGYAALDESISSSINCVAVGRSALGEFKYDGGNNTAIGHASSALLVGNVAGAAGIENTAVGSKSLYTTVDGIGNTAVGYAAMQSGDCSDNNTAIGRNALKLFTGDTSTAVGSNALALCEGGLSNTAVGYNSLALLVGTSASAGLKGDYNTCVGTYSGYATTGESNTFIGRYAGLYTSTTDNSIAIGRDALAGVSGDKVTGNYNIAIGSYSLDAVTSGASNIAVGYQAGTTLSTHANDVLIGHQARLIV